MKDELTLTIRLQRVQLPPLYEQRITIESDSIKIIYATSAMTGTPIVFAQTNEKLIYTTSPKELAEALINAIRKQETNTP